MYKIASLVTTPSLPWNIRNISAHPDFGHVTVEWSLGTDWNRHPKSNTQNTIAALKASNTAVVATRKMFRIFLHEI